MNSRAAYLTIAILLITVILALGAYFQEVQSFNSLKTESDSLQTENISLRSDLNHTASNLNSEENILANISKANNYLLSQVNRAQFAYDKLLANYSEKSYVFEFPSSNHSIPIWTFHQTMIPNSWEEWDLLDTFDNHILINTGAPAQFLIFDLESFVAYRSGGYSVPIANVTGTHFAYDVQLSEGCGVYVLFIKNLGNVFNVISPNVTATYAPSEMLTGYCAG
jgi:hypothetical protein